MHMQVLGFYLKKNKNEQEKRKRDKKEGSWKLGAGLDRGCLERSSG